MTAGVSPHKSREALDVSGTRPHEQRRNAGCLGGLTAPLGRHTFLLVHPRDDIPGYDYAQDRVDRSPVTLEELGAIERAAGLTEDDKRWLRRAGEILADQAEVMVDAWRSRIGAQPELVLWFLGPGGTPDEAYKSAVKRRFAQWVRDTCFRPRDRAWLDYQAEIGLRHTPAKKNLTDGAQTAPLVPLRYLVAFVPVVLDVRSFLEVGRQSSEETRAMELAWGKGVLVQIALWTRAYARDGLW
jgi:hypothetical protein